MPNTNLFSSYYNFPMSDTAFNCWCIDRNHSRKLTKKQGIGNFELAMSQGHDIEFINTVHGE